MADDQEMVATSGRVLASSLHLDLEAAGGEALG
jgi:hypothetical protein